MNSLIYTGGAIILVLTLAWVLYKMGQKDQGRKDELDALEHQNKVNEISQDAWIKDEPLLADRRRAVGKWLRKVLQGKSGGTD